MIARSTCHTSREAAVDIGLSRKRIRQESMVKESCVGERGTMLIRNEMLSVVKYDL